MDDYCAARSKIIPPLPWQTFSSAFSPAEYRLQRLTTLAAWPGRMPTSSRDHHDLEADDVFQTVPHLTRLTQIFEALCNKTPQMARRSISCRSDRLASELICAPSRLRMTGVPFKGDKAGAAEVDLSR